MGIFILIRSRRFKIVRGILSKLTFGLILIYFYCEYLIYYVTQIRCFWPTVNEETTEPVHALLIADTHLLGRRNGHWLDKWRREGQMQRSFQAAITLHRPEIVFVLGDLFDEGKWASEVEFNESVQKFHELFKVPKSTIFYAVVGNHDIGFHYRITPQLEKRFESNLNAPPVRLVSIRGNHVILINSMAMEGDGCNLCSRAVAEIERLSDILKCTSGSALCKGKTKLNRYSRPIIMQHFPLYRQSDRTCLDFDDVSIDRNLFEERWDCLSKESTDYLVENLNPRAVFGGHTHHNCALRHSFLPYSKHKMEFFEYTIPSFNWRNTDNPAYYLVTINTNETKIFKCSMPREITMKLTAVIMMITLILYLRYTYKQIEKATMGHTQRIDKEI